MPCATRWLTCTGTTGWFLIGCLINKLFIRGFKQAFSKSESVLNINNLGEWESAIADSAIADVEAANDDWHIRLGKRLRRGARFFGDSMCSAKLSYSQVILLPLHHLMAGYFKESKNHDTNANEMLARANRCADKLTMLMQNDIMTSDEWKLLQVADREALGNAEFRKCPGQSCKYPMYIEMYFKYIYVYLDIFMCADRLQ